MAIKILIIEDEILLAKDIEQSLVSNGYIVVGIATNYKKAKQLLNSNTPDLILCDINLRSDKTGIELICELQNKYQFQLIYLTAYSDEDTIKRASETNPDNYLTKPFNEKQLLTSINLSINSKDKIDTVDIPSKRELTIIFLLSKGYNSKKISEELNISISTVDTHRKNILRKNNFSTTAELIYHATKNGWINTN